MSDPAFHGSPQDQLDDAITEFLVAVDGGTPLDRRELLARFPGVAVELEAFFADHDRLRQIAGPMQVVRRGSSETIVETPPSGPAPRSFTGDSPTLPPSASSASAVETRGSSRRAEDASRYFGGYELLNEIARGGMGVVYKARHLRLNRIVALKMILGGQLASRDDVRRFYAEAEAAAGLDHAGIVPVYEVAEHEGQHYFTMGYVEGQSLAEVLSNGPLAPQTAAALMKKIAEAVAYAHSKGVIHRDLKPANILLQKNDERGMVNNELYANSSFINHHSSLLPRVTDFGLAKRLDNESSLTTTGQILGTPSYMPPEQAAGKVGEVNEAADIYSLGAILYAMLTGRAPFVADSPLDILVQVLESEPTMPTKVQPGIPRALEWICLRCLEKAPEQRYPSAAALAADLERFLKQEPVEARPAGIWQRFRRWVRREPALVSHLAGVSLAFLIAQAKFIQSPSDLNYHVRVSGLLLLWGASAVVFQQLLNRERWSEAARYLWSAADLLLLTFLLALLAKPLGPLLVGYPLLVAASGLFFRVRLVAINTVVAILAYAALWFWSDNSVPLHYGGVLIAALAVLGFVVGYQVRRVRVLSRYYEHRNLP